MFYKEKWFPAFAGKTLVQRFPKAVYQELRSAS